MKNQLKEIYGRRITPGVRIFLLVVISFLGLTLACNAGNDQDNTTPAGLIIRE